MKLLAEGLPWWSSGWDFVLSVQGTQVQSLVMEVDPMSVLSRTPVARQAPLSMGFSACHN